MTVGKAESLNPAVGATESFVGESKAESPAKGDRLMEEILDPENLKEALKRVKANMGSAGIDRMTVDLQDMVDYLNVYRWESPWPVSAQSQSRLIHCSSQYVL
jgi:hypothetical protein